MTTSRRPLFRLAAAFVAALIATGVLPAQSIDGHKDYLAVVTADNTPLRVSNAASFYAIGKAKAGSMVIVNGPEKYQFVPVATTGPTFRDYFGYIHQAKGAEPSIRLAPNGKSAVTLGQVHVLGPCLNEKTDKYLPDSDHSWRPIATLAVEKTVQVLETIDLTEETVYRITLPASGTVWIHNRSLRRASPEEVLAWEAAQRSAAQGQQQNPPAAGGPQIAQPPLAREEPQLPRIGDPEPTPPDTTAPAASPPANPATPVTTAGPAEAPQQTAPPAGDQAGATAPPVTAVEAAASAPETAQPTPVDQSRAARTALEDLEAAFKRLKAEPIETAEVTTLRQLYLDLAREYAEDPVIPRFADQRAAQLGIWEEIQNRKADLARARARADVTSEQAKAVQLALAHSGDYVAVGRLDASNIYNGQRLPLLFRLQDPGTGRTIAYIRPSEDFDLVTMLGQLIGISGEKAYDGGLRLNLIQPVQIDSLAPR